MENTKHLIFHHSVINLTNGHVRKVLEPDYPFNLDEKTILMKDIIEFRNLLGLAGVPLAEEYSLFEGDENDNYCIIEDTTNCGVDGYRLIKNKPDKSEMVLSKIVGALAPILSEPKITLVPDPHPANWCFDHEGKIRYIDFQPARFQRQNGEKIVGFPQPTGREYEWSVKRYYSKSGLIRMLRFNTMRAGGAFMRQLLLSIMGKELPRWLFKEITEQLELLLEAKVRRTEMSIHEALGECDVWRIDTIRELAMIVAESRIVSIDFLDKILELTRADFNIPLNIREQRVEEARKLILQNV